MQKIKKLSQWTIPVMLFLVPMIALGAIPTATVVGGGNAITMQEIMDIVKQIATYLSIIAIIIAVIFIIIGGIIWMASRGNEDMVKTGRRTILYGIYGALVVLAVGVILQTLAALVSRGFFNS